MTETVDAIPEFKQKTRLDQFIRSLYKLSELWEFQVLREKLTNERIVIGIKDGKLSEKLQLHPMLALESAIRQAKQSALVKSQQNVVHGSTEPAKVN